MYGMLVKQALLAMGMNDPEVLRMIDRAMLGGFTNPKLEKLAGDSLPIPESAETLLISAEKPDGKYTIVVICDRK